MKICFSLGAKRSFPLQWVHGTKTFHALLHVNFCLQEMQSAGFHASFSFRPFYVMK